MFKVCQLMLEVMSLAMISMATASNVFSQNAAVAPRQSWTTSRIHGTPHPPEPFKLVPAFPGVKFQLPTCIEEMPSLNRILATERNGKIFSFPKSHDVSSADLMIDLAASLPKELAGSVVSLFDAELHPKFESNHQLFVCYVHPDKGGHSRVSRLTLSSLSPPKADPGSEEVIITWPSGGHNAGCLEFGTDGMLYIATGDGSGPNPPDGLTTGQDLSDLLGAILRINVDEKSEGRAYSTPPDNPFVSASEGRPEIWAYGLRNPWKFGVDPQSGNIFAADNGWETWESVHQIVRGGNCGWPIMEGRAALRTEVKAGPTPILPPVKDHSHTEANSVIGGVVYRGAKLPELAGAFIYGDYITGTIWAIQPDKDKAYTHTTLVDTDQRIVAFTQSRDGEVYVLDYDFTGQIYELVPSGLRDISASFPRKLSQTGLFSSLTDMRPQPGVVGYSTIVNRWMDGAVASRYVAVPGKQPVSLPDQPEQSAAFPEGTVLVNDITLPQTSGKNPLRLETQILHYEGGKWRPYSYLWDESATDALLVDSIGATREVQAADGSSRTWHVNAVNECKLCHNAESRYVLGFVRHQLSDQSIAQLAGLGVVQQRSTASDKARRLVDPHDSNQSLDARARSYLHVNCGMCHQPGGNAIVSFFLRRDLPFDKLNTNKGTGIGTFGMTDAKIIVPSDPYRSVLMYRMSKLGYARMPYIGSRIVDSAGVALVEDWIRSLASNASVKLSTPLTASSPEARAFKLLSQKNSGSADERRQALAALTSSTEGALALVGLLHHRALSETEARAAIELGAVARSDIRGLFDTFIPESQRRPTLGSNVDPQVVLSRQGDVQRGKLIFFSDSARCRNCHESSDKSKSVGPTLAEIAKKYTNNSDLLTHVLKPSLKIDEPYAAYIVRTTDGQIVTGLIVDRTAQEIVVQNAEKQLIRLEISDIEEQKRSEKSLMPDAILSDLTPQEAADLIEYIRRLETPRENQN